VHHHSRFCVLLHVQIHVVQALCGLQHDQAQDIDRASLTQLGMCLLSCGSDPYSCSIYVGLLVITIAAVAARSYLYHRSTDSIRHSYIHWCLQLTILLVQYPACI
jgi:hypothetical protein